MIEYKSYINPALSYLVLAGATLFFGRPDWFLLQKDPKAEIEVRRVEEQQKEILATRNRIELGHSISNAIVKTRGAAGLESTKVDTSAVTMFLYQLGNEVAVGDEVTRKRLEYMVQRENPTIQIKASSFFEAENQDALVSLVEARASLAGLEGTTHYGSVSKITDEGKAWAWIFRGNQVSREEQLAQALSRGGFFSLKCSHCGGDSFGRLIPNANYLVMPKCMDCGLATHVFGPDTEGSYRRANDFLTGFKIPQEKVDPFLPVDHEYSDSEALVLANWRVILDRCNFEYDFAENGDSKRDVWKLPQQTWEDRVGDCEDTTILLTDALISAGFDARVAYGTWKGRGHAWCVVKVGKRQRILETTLANAETVGLRSIIEVGNDYIAFCLFDRDSIYLRRHAGELSTPDYFSNDYWQTITIHESDVEVPTELSSISTPE